VKPKTILFTLLAFALLATLVYLAVNSNLGGWFSTPTPTATNTSMPAMTGTRKRQP
jgi:hypothetical protein